MNTRKVSLRMKAAIPVLLLSALTGWCQFSSGTVVFSNLGVTDDRKIYYELPRTSGEPMQIGLAEGNRFAIALYWGPAGTTEMSALVQVGPATTFLSGAGAGMFSGGTRIIASPIFSQNGPVLSFQARAWDTTRGSTWEQVIASGIGPAGWGPIFEMDTADPSNLQELPRRVGDAAGWRGFVMGYDSSWIIPEPSTTALCVLGMASLLLLSRKAAPRR